ncbi:MAG: adenosylmethionine---8-amino-7-oxononanoate aminotransferase [Desulfovibrionales bacterium]|nr:adenosylmethionine---8-amino-7-oxononanoate aminotransferase [Desulfovibrionales bacterium]
MGNNGLFITATDTDAGKTFVTAHLLRRFRQRGRDAMAVKPVQTGCEPGADGRLCAPDVEAYLKTAEGLLPAGTREAMTMLTYRRACSPHMAGALEGAQPDIESMLARVRSLRYRPLLVEGAGGVMAPLNASETMLDLMARLGFPVLLTAENRLGAINHVLLSLAALRSRGLEVAGVVFTQPHPASPDDADIRVENAAAIPRFGKTPLLANIEHDPAPDLLDRRLDAICDHLDKLLGAA